jgi:protein-S-isoprenylcysteine O-methyltransferase Ste14
MSATRFEYRFRFAIHAVIYMLGFWSPWLFVNGLASGANIDEPSWLALSTIFFRQGWLTYNGAVIALLVVALVFTALGAWFRVWGAAYVGSGVVQSPAMHGEAMLADGPYRRTRNPLYLGTLLHTIGISLLMPPSGALLAVVLLWVFQVRLALAEEPFLAARFGQAYLDYKQAVPRFLPAPTPQVAAAGQKPHWLQAVLGELYFILAFLVLAVFGWGFDKTTIRQGILISLGVWLIVRALMPRAAEVAAVEGA